MLKKNKPVILTPDRPVKFDVVFAAELSMGTGQHSSYNASTKFFSTW